MYVHTYSENIAYCTTKSSDIAVQCIRYEVYIHKKALSFILRLLVVRRINWLTFAFFLLL